MKIAYIGQLMDKVVPPEQNSLGIWIYQVARRMANSHDVTVYTNEPEPTSNRAAGEPFQYHFIKSASYRPVRKVSRRLSGRSSARQRMLGFDLASLVYILSVAVDLRKQGCQIIHLQNYSQFVPVLRAFNRQARIVLHMQCEWLSQLDRDLIARRLQKTDQIIGVSEHITGKIRSRFPKYASRCATVHSGVDTEQFRPANKKAATGQTRRELLFVGRVSPEKGIHDLVEAFPRIALRYPQARLRLVGQVASLPKDYIISLSDEEIVQSLKRFYQREYREDLLARIPPDLQDRVIFEGFTPTPRIPELYRQAEILVNPSYSEAFGLSLVEAMASGLPVVATRAGGMVEIVEDGKTGLLVERGHPEEIAQALLSVLDSEEDRLKMGAAGRQRAVDLFSWDQTARQLERCYQEMEQRKPG